MVFTATNIGFSQPIQTSYTVPRVESPVTVDGNWDKPIWQNIEPLVLENYMGDKPEHFPEVMAKIAYDHEYIYLIWQVKDQYVRAVAQKHQDPVFQDSCVEFFFSPNQLLDTDYYNLEMNCGGTMLFHHRLQEGDPAVKVSNEDIEQMKVAHSLPRRIPEEISDEVTWTLEYAIPFEMLDKYDNLEVPQPGTIWRANLYKCADKTSHPHWLTWSPVDFPTPRFHMPQYFGKLLFE